jgi:HSP20 family protein
MSEAKEKKEVNKEKEKEALVQQPGFHMPLFRGSIFSMSPFALMRQFAEEMDNAYHAFGGETKSWSPVVEVREGGGRFMVSAELPGLKKEDVKVQMTDEALILEGERKHEKEETREGYYHSERSYGRFYRSIPLPEGVQSDKVSADFANGVLQVSMPVARVERKPREIPIQGETKARAAA